VAVEVHGGSIAVVEVEIVACLLVEFRLGSTSVEHPQYYLQEALFLFFSSTSK
jgi:hypothetical protein